MRTVLAELRAKQDLGLTDLYTGRRKLSVEARRVVRDASKAIHGMELGPNSYWLPQIMSEAIEAAEALKL